MICKWLRGTMFIAAVSFVGIASAATEFNASIWFPNTHPLTKYGYIEWAKHVEAQSHGDLKPNVFVGDALLPPKAHLSGLSSGIAQVTYHAGTYTPADLPEDNVLSMLAMGESDPIAVAMAVSDFYMNDPQMRARYKKLGIVFGGGYATPPYRLFCTSKVASLKDLKGKKIRTPGLVQAAWAKSVGAVPVSVPSSEMFTGLEKGQLDCAANAANDMKSRSLWDVAKYTSMISLGMYWAGWEWAYNADFWRGLKPQERRVLLDTMSDSLVDTMIGYIKASKEAVKEAPSHGVTIYKPTPAMTKSVQNFADQEAYKMAIAEANNRFHVKNPAGLIKRFRATLAKWKGLLKGVNRMDAPKLKQILKTNLYGKVNAKTYGMD